jgi:ribonuclease R
VPIQLDHKGAGDLATGDLAVVRPGRGRAKVERNLGSADNVENVLEALLVERGARLPFEPHEPPEPEFANRVDLRDLLTYTIDPDTAKDFDDALSFRREPEGIRAWVHIADVSYFVGAGTPLDRGGAARALDVCPRRGRADAATRPGRRPRSLRPHLTGFASPWSRRGRPRFYRSVIPPDARLTYGQADGRGAPPRCLGRSR